MTCFATGTKVTTEEGEIAVDQLKPGQRILTRDNGYQPVRWIWTTRMSGRYLFDNPHLRPVMVRKGAFGDGMPVADTMMSQNTRVPVVTKSLRLIGIERIEMLALKNLIDHDSVLFMPVVGIQYVHLVFDQHEIVAANGFWTECFNTTDTSLKGVGNAQRLEILDIFPKLKAVRNCEQPVQQAFRVNSGMIRRFL